MEQSLISFGENPFNQSLTLWRPCGLSSVEEQNNTLTSQPLYHTASLTALSTRNSFFPCCHRLADATSETKGLRLVGQCNWIKLYGRVNICDIQKEPYCMGLPMGFLVFHTGLCLFMTLTCQRAVSLLRHLTGSRKDPWNHQQLLSYVVFWKQHHWTHWFLGENFPENITESCRITLESDAKWKCAFWKILTRHLKLIKLLHCEK